MQGFISSKNQIFHNRGKRKRKLSWGLREEKRGEKIQCLKKKKKRIKGKKESYTTAQNENKNSDEGKRKSCAVARKDQRPAKGNEGDDRVHDHS